MTAQILKRVITRLICTNDNAQPRLIIRIGEIHALRALLVDGHIRYSDVEITCLERWDQTVKIEILDLDLMPLRCGNRTDDVDVIAYIGMRLLILKSKRCIARIRTDAPFSALLRCLICTAASRRSKNDRSAEEERHNVF